MDPSADLCIAYDSLQTKLSPSTFIDQWYIQDVPLTLTPQYKSVSIDASVPPIYCDLDMYNTLIKLRKVFNNINPFEQIGKSIFTYKDAVKLADIDSVHHVSGKIFTFDNKTSSQAFTFCDVAGGPGGFTQYMQYRFPIGKGYGVTLRHATLDWDEKNLDMTRFTTFYGTNKTGNLYNNWQAFIDFVVERETLGVDLVTCDAGVNNDEFLSSRLLLLQALVGIGCSKVNGNCVIRVFDTVTDVSAQIIFVLAQCFHHILIFKPVMSRPAEPERYVICIGRKQEVQSYYQLLLGAANSYKERIYLSSVFAETLPVNFEQWLVQSNTLSINDQIQALENTSEVEQYDRDKFLVIWNLLDTPSDRTSIFSKPMF